MLQQFLDMQREKLDKTPQAIEKKKERLRQAEIMLKELQALKPVADEIQRIKNSDLPEKKKQHEEIENQLREEEKKVESVRYELKKAESEEAQFFALSPILDSFTKNRDAVRNVELRIATEKKRLPETKGSQDMVTYEDMMREQESLTAKLRDLNKEDATLRKDYQTKSNELQQLMYKVQQENNKHKKQESALIMVKQHRERLEQIQKNDIEGTLAEIEEIKKQIPRVEEELANMKKKQALLRTQNTEEANDIEITVSSLEQEVIKLRSSTLDVKTFVENNHDDEISKLENAAEKRRIRLDEINIKESEYQTINDTKQEMLNNKNDIKRNIQDNLNYRQKKRELEARKDELQKLRNQLRQAASSKESKDSDDEESSIRIIDEKSFEQYRKKRESLDKQKATLNGMKATHKGVIIKIQEELKSNDKLKDIEKRYRATLIKTKTVQMANDDLDRYYRALDQALMKYHAMKMAEINAIIKELWQKTYRGQDIDTIEIRADAEGGTATKRSYNYRVVMKKAEVGLDMRGRCSAGQKVLACLIIRLALAEAFCIDCGVLALDEPTTNLDYDNVSSLADSLQVIISERRKQSNFQLIVITHDEDFVQKLGRSDFVDHYYRISKDSVTGFTQIDRQDFTN
jgi:DNA repair protein RAD50